MCVAKINPSFTVTQSTAPCSWQELVAARMTYLQPDKKAKTLWCAQTRLHVRLRS
jgi:hypothetical protein